MGNIGIAATAQFAAIDRARESTSRLLSLLDDLVKSRLLVQKQIDKLQTLYDSLAQEYFG